MTLHRPPDRLGFTFVELLTVMAIVGILVGVALPRMRNAIVRADAATVVSDGETVALAALEYLTEAGRYPSNSDWGRIPAELVDRLPDGFDFEHGDAEYQWYSLTSSKPEFYGAHRMGVFAVRYSNGALAEAMQAHRGDLVLWTATTTLFLYPG